MLKWAWSMTCKISTNILPTYEKMNIKHDMKDYFLNNTTDTNISGKRIILDTSILYWFFSKHTYWNKRYSIQLKLNLTWQ